MRTWTIALLAAATLAMAGCSRGDPAPVEDNYSAEPLPEPEPADARPVEELPRESPPPPPSVAENLSTVIEEPAEQPVDPDDQTLDDASATGMTTRAQIEAGDEEGLPADTKQEGGNGAE